MSPTEGPSDLGAGSFAEESARLLGAFREWVGQTRESTNEAATQGDSATPGDSHAPECTHCPVCQGLALLRGAKPEVAEHLAEALSSLAAAVVALLPKDSAPAERRRPEPAQHIDVVGDDRAGAAG